ncbi:hypothetical protein GQ457_08G027210 [Hibiscus cannabinus]
MTSRTKRTPSGVFARQTCLSMPNPPKRPRPMDRALLIKDDVASDGPELQKHYLVEKRDLRLQIWIIDHRCATMEKEETEVIKIKKEENDAIIQNLVASVRNLEIQIGQIANSLNNIPQGTLSSDTKDVWKKGKEQCQVVTPRSGEQVKNETHAMLLIICQEEKSMPAGEPRKVKKEEAEADDAKTLFDARKQSDATTLTKHGENLALNCHGIKYDVINQKCNAKTIKQQNDSMKRGVLKWLVIGRKNFVKNLDQDEDEYASTTKRFFSFLILKHYQAGNQINVNETILFAKVPKVEPMTPMSVGSVVQNVVDCGRVGRHFPASYGYGVTTISIIGIKCHDPFQVRLGRLSCKAEPAEIIQPLVDDRFQAIILQAVIKEEPLFFPSILGNSYLVTTFSNCCATEWG